MSVYSGALVAAYFILLAAVLGAVMGSFLTCAAERTANGLSFLTGRSHCDACGHVLAPADLIPIVSWFRLKGHCRYCGAEVPKRCVIAEIACAIVSVLCLLRFDLTALCLRNWVFLCVLYYLSLVDWECFEIPDGCHILSVAVWLAALPFVRYGAMEIWLRPISALVYGGAMLALSMFLDRVLGRESLGGGDIKLFAVVGLYLGFTGTMFALILASVLGLALVKWRGAKRSENVPFGPAISAATAIMLFFGDDIVHWYLGLLG